MGPGRVSNLRNRIQMFGLRRDVNPLHEWPRRMKSFSLVDLAVIATDATPKRGEFWTAEIWHDYCQLLRLWAKGE